MYVYQFVRNATNVFNAFFRWLASKVSYNSAYSADQKDEVGT